MNALNVTLNLLTFKQMQELFAQLLPKKHTIFFADKGLTQTEASHKANIIKEKADRIAALLKNTAAYKDVVDFKGKEVMLDTFEKLSNLEELCLEEGEMYSLSSWLREGVKAKELLLKLVKVMAPWELESNKELRKVFGEVIPTKPYIEALILLDEDAILGEWTIAERSEYLSLLAKAAHLGKKLHNDGALTKIRKDLHAKKNTSFKELHDSAGYSTFVVTHHPLYEVEEIDKIFFNLQEQHRSTEAKLNWYKAKLQNELTSKNIKVSEEHALLTRKILGPYEKELRNFNTLREVFNDEYNAWVAELEVTRAALLNYISQIRIVIPKDLEHIAAKFADKK